MEYRFEFFRGLAVIVIIDNRKYGHNLVLWVRLFGKWLAFNVQANTWTRIR